MDAIPKLRWGWAWTLLLSGCTWDTVPPPTTHQNDPSEAQPRQQSEVVEDTAPTSPADAQPSDEVSSAVLGYIKQIDDAYQQTQSRDRLRPRNQTTLQQASDEHNAPASQPHPREAESKPSGHHEQHAETPIVNPPAVESAPAPEPVRQPPPAPSPLEPPEVTGLRTRQAPGFDAKLAPPDAPGVNAAAAARVAPASLREFLEQLLPGEDDSFRAQLDLRMLWVVAGDYDKAREPLSMVAKEQQALASRFVEAWIAIREAHMGDLNRSAGLAAEELAQLQAALALLSDLEIPVVEICSAVRGYGQYDVLKPASFVTGQPAEFVVYCEVRDFLSEQRDDGCYHTVFDLTTAILNRSGEIMIELRDTEIADRCRTRRHDCFIPRLVRLPATLSPGMYVAKVTVVDKLAQKVAENRASFEVVARP